MSSKVIEYTFRNGIRLIYSKNRLPISSLCIGFYVGSLNEKPKLRGASHFLEHMLFKGTKEQHTTKDITDLFANMGVEFNAFTDKNMTGYIAKCNSVYVGDVIKIFGDLLRNSIIDEDEMEKEKNVVIEELKRIHDNPMIYLSDLMASKMYEGSQLSGTIGGNYDTIKKYKRKDVMEYYKKNYVKENMVVSIISNLDLDEIKKMIRETELYRIPSGRISEQIKGDIKLQEKPRYVFHQRKELEQIQIGIGFRTINMFDPAQFSSDYVNVILAGNMNSRLFMELREKNGLSYSITIDDTAYEQSGNFTILTSIDKDKIFNFNGQLGGLPIIFNVLMDLKNNGITEEEYKNARNYLKGSMMLELEDSLSLATYNCKQVLFDFQPRTFYKNLLKKYENVKLEEINEWIKNNFRYDNITIGLMGNFNNGNTIPKMKKRLNKLTELLK